MHKDELIKHFSYRLREAMITAGYQSPRSPTGVNIHKLTEITGYSAQICRKYLRGEALPEASKLFDIASKLFVSPGWLLFGENPLDAPLSGHNITLSKSLLLYIFSQASKLYGGEQASDDVPEFLLALAKDISEINANEEQSKKIIDLALSSAKHFRLQRSAR